MRRLLPVLLVALVCLAPATQAGFKTEPSEAKPAPRAIKPEPAEPKPAPGEVAPGDIKVVEAEFGVLRKLTDGSYQLLPSKFVPLVNGLSFGWQMRVRTNLEKVTLKEELILPAPPKQWDSDGGDPTFKISPDGKTATIQKEVELDEEGLVQNIWSIAKGDPAGNYEIRVSLNGKLVRTFKFRVEAAE